MAEAFGIAAGAFGVFSLTLELLKIVKSAHRSVKLMKSVLATTSEVEIGLSTIEKLLTEIGALSTDATSDCGVFMCLERCRPRLQMLKDILQDIRETKSTNREKVKKAFRIISYEQRLSEASGLLRETIDCLSLGLLVLQLHETRQQSINLSTMNQTIAWIAAQQTKEVSSFGVSNDVQRSIKDLSQRLASLEATINHPSLSNEKLSRESSVESYGPVTKLHFGDRTKSTISATLKDDKITSNRFQTFLHEAHSGMDATKNLLVYHNGSTFFKASEIYSITHRHLNLLLGTLSMIYMRKRYRRMRKEDKDDIIQSWEVKIKFSPSWCFDKGFWARLWTNASGGCNVQQSLTMMHTVSSRDEIWAFVSHMDIVSIREGFMKKKYSVNTVDEYGRSLLGLACRGSRGELVRFLLDAGAMSQGVDDNGRNTLVYCFDIRGPHFLGSGFWEIYNLLVERCQLDPSEPDWNGRNFWHLFCENAPLEKEFPWQSIRSDFSHILNERDNRGRTSTFILSSNPKSNIDLFRWHLNNKASISIPQVDGLTCLHAAIASLEPQREKSHINLEDLTGYPESNFLYRYGEEDRENQRKRVELLICQGANVFAVSNLYGTPTDIARLTGNFPLWIEALRNSGFDPKKVLAADKEISRHQHFLSSLRLARNLQRESRIRWQTLQDIFVVFDSFEKDKKSITEPIIPEWECLPTSPLIMCMGTYQGNFLILKDVLKNAILKDAHAEGQGQSFLVNADIDGGKYQAGFLHGRTTFCIASPSYQEKYNKLDKYLEILAEIASGDHTFNADTIDWETHRRFVDITKAAATLERNRRSRHLSLRIGLMHAPENAESTVKMPGSWPAEQ
ncbi:hypothetical protein BGW36DRAFT_212349 [Talaromyces proteolyticus]|uniref:Fungal N-terminal domain-containing protein n=1 Tax=Talaromyces proteolyticus TaxID=1131652 RepID=A0AAD4KJR4_9EURO|nr:uncharacterized protein BGW36DRAFT_212349 [Talaromyces proteolyticus]KAH8693886.1 hypothetical protein BGW36DRAFT_212349 [Talaromyces proteolyticus]